MRAFKKALLATLSVGVVSAAIATSAMAAAPTISSSEYDAGTVSVAVANGTAEEQLTVVIFKDGAASDANGLEAGEILYINQDAGNADIFNALATMGLKGNYTVPTENDTTGDGTLSYGTYTIRVGGSKYDAFAEATFEVAPTEVAKHLYGDVNLNGDHDTDDLGRLMAHLTGTTTLEGDMAVAANINKNSDIDTDDLGRLMSDLTGTSAITEEFNCACTK